MTDTPVFKMPLRETVVAGKEKYMEEKEDVNHVDTFLSSVSNFCLGSLTSHVANNWWRAMPYSN